MPPSADMQDDAATINAPDVEKTVESDPSPPRFSVPDGGLEAWSVVAGGFLGLFSTFGYINAWGVFQEYYVRTTGRSNSAIAWIGSFQLWLMFTMGIFIGRPFDDGHGRLLVCLGATIWAFAIFMTSLCKEYWQIFLAQGVCAGIGLGTIFLPAISVIPHWFMKRRALATGIVVSGSSVGGVVFPIMLNKLLARIGYADAVRASAYLLLGCLVGACLLIKPRIPGRSKRPAHMQFPDPNFKEIMTHGAYLLVIAGGFLVMWGIFIPFFYVQVFGTVHGVDPTLSFYLLSILNAGSIFGRTLPNLIADRLGVFNMLICASFCSAVMIFVWLACTSTAGAVVFSIIYGFTSGAYVSLMPGVFASMSNHVGEVGIRIGIAWAIMGLAALSGTPIAGALLGNDPAHYVWWRPAVFAGTSLFVGTGLMVLSRTWHAKAKGTAKV